MRSHELRQPTTPHPRITQSLGIVVPVFDAQSIDVLRGIFADVCSDANATPVEMDGEDDHVHLLVEYPPKVAVSKSLLAKPVATVPSGSCVGITMERAAFATVPACPARRS